MVAILGITLADHQPRYWNLCGMDGAAKRTPPWKYHLLYLDAVKFRAIDLGEL